MTAMMPLRIAANDPGLAHALTRHAVVRGGERRCDRLLASVGRGTASVAGLSRVLRRTYGPLLAWEHIARLDGTRAKGEWVILTEDGGGGFVPVHVKASRAGLATHELALHFTPHAVARLAQRTIGAADMQRIGPVLVRHLLLVLDFIEKHKLWPASFHTATPEGVFLWKHSEHSELVAGTWLGAAGAADPQVRADCATTDERRGALRVVAVAAAL
jgi:hypothetical protein